MDQNLRSLLSTAQRNLDLPSISSLIVAAGRANQAVFVEDLDYDYEEGLFRVGLGSRSGELYVERAVAERGSNYSRFGWRPSSFEKLRSKGCGHPRKIKIHLIDRPDAGADPSRLYRYFRSLTCLHPARNSLVQTFSDRCMHWEVCVVCHHRKLSHEHPSSEECP